MEESTKKKEGDKEIKKIKTFHVPFDLEETKKNFTITNNTPYKVSKEQIINQAFKFHSEGNILEAAKSYRHFINQGYSDQRVFSNYGVILQSLGKLQEAELSTKKAIKLNPNFTMAHFNLGCILIDLGKLQEAELSTRKAIELNPNFADAHYNLGNILKDLGKRENAINSLYKAIELGKDYNLCLSVIGDVLLTEGNFTEGVTKLKAGAGSIEFNLKNGLSIN